MKRLLLTLGLFSVGCSGSRSNVVATITQDVLVKDVVPFGINLGSWTFWGAEQLMSNVIKNPGFEGLIDGAIVLPVHSGGGNFDESPAWLARPDAFWEGAHYSIRTGTHAGEGGTLSHSVLKNAAGLPSFTVEGNGALPDTAEAVALVKVREDGVPTQWWFSKDPANSFSPERRQIRPGSPGTRSLRISAGSQKPAEVASYVDSIGERAGKLLPLTGKWTLSFWARLDRGRASLRTTVGREGSELVLDRSTVLSGAWTNFQMGFEAGKDSGPPGQISLRFQVTGDPAGDVLIDDVDLHQDDDAGFPFRQEVVATLKTLHPSYLRDWQGQLGDTLSNRTASSFARKAWRYRPGDDTQTDFGYGLSEFLELSKEIGAAPWIVIPTVFTDEDCAGLGAWLATPGRLAPEKEILVEFGNENWNELFRPAGISDPVVHGHAADRCFAAVREHAQGIRLRTVVNAQFANAAAVASYGAESQAADIVAVAPYFAFSVPTGLAPARRNELLFPDRITPDRIKPMTRIAEDVKALHKEVAVYEVSLHTLSGTAPPNERQPMVEGVASGSALARNLLDSLVSGIKRQCVYSFAGFDAALDSVQGYTPLWGIVRDIREANHFRPTGLALQLLNDTLAGDMQKVDLAGPGGIWVYAFQSRGRVSVVAISGSEAAQHVTVKFPPDAKLPAKLKMVSLSADSLRQTTSATTDQAASFDIEPWGMVVLRP